MARRQLIFRNILCMLFWYARVLSLLCVGILVQSVYSIFRHIGRSSQFVTFPSVCLTAFCVMAPKANLAEHNRVGDAGKGSIIQEVRKWRRENKSAAWIRQTLKDHRLQKRMFTMGGTDRKGTASWVCLYMRIMNARGMPPRLAAGVAKAGGFLYR